LAVRAGYICGVIVGRVIYDDDFGRLLRLSERALDCRRQKAAVTIARDDDRDRQLRRLR